LISQISKASRRFAPPAMAELFRKIFTVNIILNSKNKIMNFCIRIVNALFMILIIWIFLINIIKIGQNHDFVKISLLLFLLIVVLTIIYFPKPMANRIFGFIMQNKWIRLFSAFSSLLLGFIARFGFALLDYVPVMDSSTYYINAASLIETGKLSSGFYIGMFPHIYAYTVALTAIFKITGIGLWGVILLNTFFDILSAFLIGYLIYLLTRSYKWPIFSFCIWWLSPFNILFCAVSLPVIAVNTFIIILIVLAVHLFNNINCFKYLIYFSVVFAVAIAILDAFRPISIIVMIAILIYYTFLIIKESKWQTFYNCIISLIAIILLSALLSYLWTQTISSATGFPANKYKAGWNIYVGSNYDTNGRYSEKDDEYLVNLMIDYDRDISKIFYRLQNEGINRWKELNFIRALQLMINKSLQLAGDMININWDLKGSYPYFDDSWIKYDIIRIISGIYWYFILIFTFHYSLKRKKCEPFNFILFIKILIIGFFLAFLAVEVMNRYFTIFFPMFTVLSILGFHKMVEKCKNLTPESLHLKQMSK